MYAMVRGTNYQIFRERHEFYAWACDGGGGGGDGGSGNGHLFLEGVNVLSTRMIWHKSTAIWISRCVVTNVYKYISTPKIE